MKAAALCPDKLQFVVHQRSWWIVHTQPTKELSHARPKSHQRSWWIVHTQPTKGLSAHPSRIPPTQLVDRSCSAYKGTGGRAVPNRTDVVRGLVILSIETGLGSRSRQCMN